VDVAKNVRLIAAKIVLFYDAANNLIKNFKMKVAGNR
jgi:hypothetical protein